jgi:branched-subunit amino acid transport protein AzlD
VQNTRLLTAILLMGAIIYFTRLLPFLFFRNRQPPALLNYLEENLPPLIMLLLVIYCVKDVKWLHSPYGAPEVVAIGVVVAVHLWRKNALLSIFSGTVLYMLALRLSG